MNIEHLARMVNDIANYFAAEPDHATGVSGVADHLRKFWDPVMRRADHRTPRGRRRGPRTDGARSGAAAGRARGSPRRALTPDLRTQKRARDHRALFVVATADYLTEKSLLATCAPSRDTSTL